MADVQLERGHVQIANRLHEAIIAARFSERQLQILMVLFRFTYGWRRRSVLLTELELAQQVTDTKAKRASGAFRAELADLLMNGVILRADAPEVGRRGQMIWAINKDFERWGRFSTAESKLAAIFGSKPRWSREHERGLFDRSSDVAQDQATDDDQHNEQGDEPVQDMRPSKRPYNEEAQQGDVARKRSSCGLIMGQKDEAKSLNGETYERPKDMKDSGTTQSTTPLPPPATTREPEPTAVVAGGQESSNGDNGYNADNAATTGAEARKYAVGLATAANGAITERWGEQPNPLHYAGAIELAAELMLVGVPLATARAAVAESCGSNRNLRPPLSLRYFREPIMRAYRAEEQRALDAQDTGSHGSSGSHGVPRGTGGLTPVAKAMGEANPKRLEREQLEMQHGEAKRAAALTWGENPANRARYAEIARESALAYADFPQAPWVEKAIVGTILDRCAEAAGFPAFEAWCGDHAAVSPVGTGVNGREPHVTGAPDVPVSAEE